MASGAAASSVTITSDVPADMPPLDADPVRLRQVLGNLLSNALRHTPEGDSVRVTARPEGPAALIAVVDTGEGIDRDDLPHVFERFFRADRSRSRATGGSGLGLAIARRLTEAHGGTIEIDSARGQGTTVTLTWPLAAAKTPYPSESE
jgi:two-component system sensor histidine kinase BaeS